MKETLTRRRLLRTAAWAGAGFWISDSYGCAVAGPPRRRLGPADRLNIACIGVGGQGAANLRRIESENIVALCDVDDERAADAYSRFPKARRFRDYRRLFDDMHKDIDAVVISTPDHMHAPITLAAIRLGKHVYCEKPLTRTVSEARQVAASAAKYRVVTQMGNSGNASSVARGNVELVRAGVIGTVREAYAWTDRPGGIWPQGLDRPKDSPPVPQTLRWDLWLGVAPERPYNPAYVPVKWRGWWDFGTGALGDMGCHACNVAFWALDLHDPTAVECEVSDRHAETGPAWSRIVWHFPARGDRPAVKLHWYDGGKKPPAALVGDRELSSNGSLLVGDKGTLYISNQGGSTRVLLPEEKFRDFEPPAPTIPRSPGHHAEWIAACKGLLADTAHMSHFGRAAVMTEVLLLGNIVVRTGRRIEWDAGRMRVTNLPEADRLVRPVYRPGWL